MVLLAGVAHRWDVIGVGENSVDHVYLVRALPQPGGSLSKTQILDRKVLCGGQMATAIATCASLGLRTKYVGVAGSDEHCGLLRTELARRGVDLAALAARDEENRYAVILVDASTGERVVLWHRGSGLNLRPEEMPLADLAQARVVHVDQTDQSAALRAAKTGRAGGALVTTDIDELLPVTPELMSVATHAIFAEGLPQQMTGIGDLEPALRRIRSTCGATLVVTLGKDGAAALEGDRFHREPAFSVSAIDTTGAGDVFRGGFIYALLSGQPVDGALRVANAAAAVSCTRVGALNGVPTLAEIAKLTEG
jgi:sulfofructose kinase